MSKTLKKQPPNDSDGGWFSRERLMVIVLLAVTAIAIYLCYLVALPFMPALAWALALAVVARPLHNWIAAKLQQPATVAGLAVLLVTMMIVAPTLFVVHRLIIEAAHSVEIFQEHVQSGRWRQAIEKYPQLAELIQRVEKDVNLPAEAQNLIGTVLGSVSSVVAGSLAAIVQLLLTLFFLFYFFRDRDKGLRSLQTMLPLTSDESRRLFKRVAEVIQGTVFGTLVVAMIQGFLGGLMFWFLGLPGPILWGVVMGLLAVVPVLGAFVIWAPAAVYLGLQGEIGKAVILAAWGTVVVGMIDNLLYPILVGTKLRLHTVPVFIAVVGGLSLFGAAGIVLGPVLLAVTIGLVETWRERTEGGHTAEASLQAE